MDPVAEQLDAYNARDLDRFVSCYAPDVVVRDGRGQTLMQGHEELRERYRELFATSPELHCKLLRRTVAGDYVVDEEEVTGMGNRAAGEAVHAVAIYRVEAGKITLVTFLK